MELNDREKFIVHFMAATIFGMRENASEYAISSAVEKLRKARCKNLTVADGKNRVCKQYLSTGFIRYSCRRDFNFRTATCCCQNYAFSTGL